MPSPSDSMGDDIGNCPLCRLQEVRNVKIPVVVGECSGCCHCLMACPTGAAGPVSPKTVVVEKCTGCGKCVAVCPNKCRIMREP